MPASTVLQFRRGTASQWSTANPILAQGELGYESDTNLYKVGDGSTVWSGLSYGGLIGPQQTEVLENYGDGSDGDVTISSGTTTLVRDMYYNNLTITGTGALAVAGWRVFVKNTLDLSSAPAGAIRADGVNGNSTATATGGVGGAAITGTTVGSGASGSTGGNTGGNAAGGMGLSIAAIALSNGGAGGNGGSGGAGSTGGVNAGGAAGGGGGITATFPIRRYETELVRGVTIINAGNGGRGGGGGGSDSVVAGRNGAGGGGASGASVLALWCRVINRGASTAVSAIRAIGGNGGNGANGALGITGGGGGGSAGGGGWIFIQYDSLTGATGTNIIDASGGIGGNAGNGFGVGAAGGVGGGGGAGGRITLLNVRTSIGSETFGAAGTAGSANSGLTGGTGGAGNTTRVSL